MLATRVDVGSAEYKANHEANLALVGKLGQALALSREGGGEKAVQRHLQKGKLLPRERIELILDPDSWFLELCPLAGYEVRGVGAGAGVVGGIGLVRGIECLVTASDATQKGGAINEYGLKKSFRIGEIAATNGLPGIALIESAGADLPNQSRIFVPGGASFREITRKSQQRLPSVCVVFGSSTAGGAYLPGMSDYVVMVKGEAKVYLAGPPLVKMATGEESDHEELGGADMHSRVSGVSDYLAQDERDACRLAREIVGHLNWQKRGQVDRAPVEEPLYPAEELLGIIPRDIRVPFDQREVIARLVDGSRFDEFKREYGPTLVCGWARLNGYLIGILANNGILFSESACKGAQFIQLCNQRAIPLLFLQNINGFMVGRKYEEGGIIKHGAKLINAVANSTVPILTVMTGASYGAGNYGMAGRAYEPRFLFTWPNHKIAVMGPDQLAGVLEIIRRDAAMKRGEGVDETALATIKAMISSQITKESDAFYATSQVWDDAIIDPRDTRVVLSIALSAALTREVEPTTSWGVFRH
jgi:acetyl-CoA carboxylase carboxyltransferase component